jgi:hypothetical protein
VCGVVEGDACLPDAGAGGLCCALRGVCLVLSVCASMLCVQPPPSTHHQPSLTLPLPSVLPRQVPITCNGVAGIFHVARQRVACGCGDCASRPERERLFTPTQFEQHAGAGSAKKWKASIRVEPGTVPEVPASGAGMPIGRWLEIKGIEVKSRPGPGEWVGVGRGCVWWGCSSGSIVEGCDVLAVKAGAGGCERTVAFD